MGLQKDRGGINMKKFWMIVGVMFVIGAIGNMMDDEPTTTKEKEPTKVTEPAPAKEEPKPAPEPEESGPSETLTETYLQVLQDSYGETGTVTYEKPEGENYGIFKITPTDPDVATAFGMIAAGDMPRQMWDTMTDSLLNISESMGNDYALYLMNPANHELVLFSAIGGQKVFDYMDEEGV